MTFISGNLRFLRKLKGLTQEQFAQKAGIKRSLVGAYEEGRAEPNLENLIKFTQILEVSVQDIITRDISVAGLDTAEPDVRGESLRILSISVDKENNELIHLVPQKASAGYLNGYSDPEFIAELPVFNVPAFRNGSFRAFEISGDSMLPLVSGTVIIGKYLENWETIKDNNLCIVVTSSEGVVFKRIFNDLKKSGKIRLVSDNPVYEPYELDPKDIIEVWEARGYFSTVFPEPELSVQEVASMVMGLKKEVEKLKEGR
jgi:transcriptional regulator with XRE-family HTH domain